MKGIMAKMLTFVFDKSELLGPVFLPCNFYGPVGAKWAQNAYTLPLEWTGRSTRGPKSAQNERAANSNFSA